MDELFSTGAGNPEIFKRIQVSEALINIAGAERSFAFNQ
jgi:hypothetical protein